jgi:hypothetical protein
MYSTGGSGLGIRANEGIADFATESEFILNFSMILRVYDAYTSNSPDCKRQLSRRHLLADLGVDRDGSMKKTG